MKQQAAAGSELMTWGCCCNFESLQFARAKKGKRSRGELVLEALDHADASDAAEAITSINEKHIDRLT